MTGKWGHSAFSISEIQNVPIFRVPIFRFFAAERRCPTRVPAAIASWTEPTPLAATGLAYIGFTGSREKWGHLSRRNGDILDLKRGNGDILDFKNRNQECPHFPARGRRNPECPHFSVRGARDVGFHQARPWYRASMRVTACAGARSTARSLTMIALSGPRACASGLRP